VAEGVADGVADGVAEGVTRLRLAMLAAVWLGVVSAAALVPGCYGRNCDASFDTWGDGPGEGKMIGPDTWESTPVEGPWLPLPGARTWFFRTPELATRRVKSVTPYLSGSNAPVDAGENYTIGSGNSALVFQYPDSFSIANGTCAAYSLRVLVEFEPGGGSADAGDAGEGGGAARRTGDASPEDASADAN
jgi:hypothetical protein